MRLLAIETSCDETSAAVVEKEEKHNLVKVISNVTSSSLKMHTKTGGIIPENAAREQVKFIIPVIIQALLEFDEETNIKNKQQQFITANNILKERIDALAVTVGPGLIGSLLVGVETTKTFSYALNKPIIPVNHLLAHLYANFINSDTNSYLSLRAKRGNLLHSKEIASSPMAPRNDIPSFPFIGLIVSGGHTDLLLFKSHTNYKWLGGTRDDAAGEAFDKIARILGLPYPGGPEIEKRAKNGDPKAFNFPRPMIDSNDFDFSFSGLKTAVQREISTIQQLNNKTINDLCASIQQSISDVLVSKTLKAAQKYQVKTILLGGGVSANQILRNEFQLNAKRYLLDADLFFPEKKFSTDNAAMIGTYAIFNNKPIPWSKIKAQPELYFT